MAEDLKFTSVAAAEQVGLNIYGKACAKKMYSSDTLKTVDQWKKQWMKDGIADFDFAPVKEEVVAEVKTNKEAVK